MARTKVVLDRQAEAKTFDFGTTSASGEGLVTINNGTAAATNVVLETKGAVKINTLSGVLKASTGVVSGGATTTDLPEGTNEYYTDAKVRLNRLDQMAAPTAAVSLNSQKITNLDTPTAAGDAATKGYVDSTAQGLDVKNSVRVATTATGTLATSFANASVVDGVTLSTGDRILLKDQSTGAENGIYTVNASGAPTRATDADASSEVNPGMFVFVEEGTTNADSGWILTNNGTITLGTTALTFSQFSGAGQITAGDALTKTGNTLDVAVDNSSIEVNADALRVKASGITNAMLAGSIDLTTKVTGVLPIANGGTNANTASAARTSLGLEIGTDVAAQGHSHAAAGSAGQLQYNNSTVTAGTGITYSSDVNTDILTGSADKTFRLASDTDAGIELVAGTSVTLYGAANADNYVQVASSYTELGNSAGLYKFSDGLSYNAYGILDFSNMATSDKTFAFPNSSGTVYVSGGPNVAVADGGTGQDSYTDGQLLIGNSTGNTLTKASLTAGSGISITPGAGSITIAATGSAGYQRATAVTGTQDSSNKIFTIANSVSSGSEQVFLNGQLLTPGGTNDYVISGTTVTFQAAIDAPAATDTIRVYGTY